MTENNQRLCDAPLSDAARTVLDMRQVCRSSGMSDDDKAAVEGIATKFLDQGSAEQNSASRTRDEQVAEYFFDNEFQFAEDMTEEAYIEALEIAEARGAAEQRRKDAEECCPVYQVWDDQGARWENCPENNEDWRWTHAAEADKRIYYTHPANVAALEGRIAELEGALSSVREAIEFCDPAVLGCTMWMPGSPPETVVDFISSTLKREGTPS